MILDYRLSYWLRVAAPEDTARILIRFRKGMEKEGLDAIMATSLKITTKAPRTGILVVEGTAEQLDAVIDFPQVLTADWNGRVKVTEDAVK